MEEQQNNNLSMEILNGNAESLTGLVGNAQALKEPGTNHSVSFTPVVSCCHVVSIHSGELLSTNSCSFPDTVGAPSM